MRFESSQTGIMKEEELNCRRERRDAIFIHQESVTSIGKAETENRDENETDDLIAVTKQKMNKENEEKQKEDDNIRHQLRKLTEQQTIEQTNIDQLRQDFLKLAPNKVQKPRIDAAYEKQKQKNQRKNCIIGTQETNA